MTTDGVRLGPLPRLHVITDDRVLAEGDWSARAEAVLVAGGARVALHVRGPATNASVLLGLLEGVVPAARATGALVVVNDRVDVALAAEIGAVHLGGRSLAPEHARTLMGPGALIGVSCHDVDGVHRAVRDGADYVFLGTIHTTESHPGRTGLGTGGITRVRAEIGTTPIVGIGGITPDRVAPVMDAGAQGVAAMRGIWDATDPEKAVRLYLQALNDRDGEHVGSDGHHPNSSERQGA